MARGNDGNLLQHGIEAELASRLARDGGLHLVCTHGMAPFEAWENPGRNARLMHWLGQCDRPKSPDDPAVLHAYRNLGASPSRYPNTAKIVAALLGRERLTGFICEVCPDKVAQLRSAWSSTSLIPLEGSWRTHLKAIPATEPDRPWLLTMDPMSFFPEDRYADDNRLYPSDLSKRLQPMSETFFASGQPGAVSVFCFELMRGAPTNRYALFLEAARVLGEELGVGMRRYEVSYGNPHVGVVFTRQEELLDELDERWSILHEVTLASRCRLTQVKGPRT